MHLEYHEYDSLIQPKSLFRLQAGTLPKRL